MDHDFSTMTTTSDIPEPEVARCFFDAGFSPPLPAMRLRWWSSSFRRRRVWRFPAGLDLLGPAPQRFGITIHRVAADAYYVRVLWDRARFQWCSLSRAALAASSLGSFLAVIGTDLNYLLDQPISQALPEPIFDAA
jgi:hypothetical protein